jgi:hypothetical protein
VAGSGAFAQRTTVPLKDFNAIPVTAPTTPERVGLAWRSAAAQQSWQVVSEPEGTLLVSTVKDESYPIKVRVRYDANSYSVSYVESQNLKYGPPPSLAEWTQSRRRFQDAAAWHSARFKGSPDNAYAVAREAYIHPSYEFWVRELLTAVRQQIVSPTPVSALVPLEEAGVKLMVSAPVLAGRTQARSVNFKDAATRQWSITRFDQTALDAKSTRDRANETLKAFRDEANRRRLQPSDSTPVIVDEALTNAGTLVVVASQSRRGTGREIDSHVDFRIVWPGRLPDGHVQGTVDWTGDLQPGLGEVLDALRKLEPAR